MRCSGGTTLGVLTAALVLVAAHGGENAGILPSRGSSQGLDTLMGLLDKHSQNMNVQQLGELRAVMRQMRSSKQRLAVSAANPSAPPGTRESFDVRRRVLAADVDTAQQFEQVNKELRARGEVVQAYDPINGALSGGGLRGKTYSVILYKLAPFVIIADPESAGAVLDPGNLNQTRTPGNGLLSGFTIDLLETMSGELGVTFNYYYPCSVAPHTAQGVCEPSTASTALNWLKSGDTDPAMAAMYYGNMTQFCPDYRCFVAAATKILASRVQDFRMTQPFLDTGFVLAVNENKASPPFMSAFFPFTTDVWFMIIVEIIIVGIGFIYVEGYGTNEALWVAADVSELVGLAKVTGLVLGFLTQLYDAGYWATTLLLGSADKAPTTSAGRVLVTVQLFFALILMSLYTGGVATFLMTETLNSKVMKFSDFVDKNSFYYNKENTLCVPSNAASVAAYLATQQDVLVANTGVATFSTVAGVDVADCIRQVYVGDATATFFDAPVIAVQLTKMKMEGMCGQGGFCSNEIYLEETTCRDAKADWTSVKGSMGIVGNVFNPFGYGLAFKRGTLKRPEGWDYVGFSQAIQALRETNVVAGLSSQYVPDPAQVSCAAGAQGPIQLSFINISGLLTITFIILFVGLIVGMMEHITALCVKICPCCKPAGEDEKGEEEGEDAANDAAQVDKKNLIHTRITELQERLKKMESLLGVEDPPQDSDGVEDDKGDGAKGNAAADFFGGFFNQFK